MTADLASLSDSELLVQYAAGDGSTSSSPHTLSLSKGGEAFAEIARRHGATVWWAARRVLGAGHRRFTLDAARGPGRLSRSGPSLAPAAPAR